MMNVGFISQYYGRRHGRRRIYVLVLVAAYGVYYRKNMRVGQLQIFKDVKRKQCSVLRMFPLPHGISYVMQVTRNPRKFDVARGKIQKFQHVSGYVRSKLGMAEPVFLVADSRKIIVRRLQVSLNVM